MSALLTVLEAADELRINKQTVYRLVWTGELGWTDVSSKGAKRRRIRISQKALSAYLSRRERVA